MTQTVALRYAHQPRLWEPRCATTAGAQVDDLVCVIQEAETAEALQCIDKLLKVSGSLMQSLAQGLQLPKPAQQQVRCSRTKLPVS